MKPLYKGLLIGGLHVAIVCSLGVKLLYDRATRPHVWVQAVPYDPDLPIRGRYVSLQLMVDAPGIHPPEVAEKERRNVWRYADHPVLLKAENGRLVAVSDPGRDQYDYRGPRIFFRDQNNSALAILRDPVAYFIPEHVPDPSRRSGGEELWVEVTLPKKGPPRPIQLGVKKDGRLTPLNLD